MLKEVGIAGRRQE